jgi:C4-dicarboxylate-specific signal transduction histidine kinase
LQDADLECLFEPFCTSKDHGLGNGTRHLSHAGRSAQGAN